MASPFAQAVVTSMRRLYPEILADQSFDNTGLLLEAPFNAEKRKSKSILLTVDLTRAVADEAIENNHSVVVAYHPIIFRGIKALTTADPQQHTLLRLATEGISVYCPHTAVDAVPDGMADWLCDIVAGKLDDPEPEAHTAQLRSPSQGSETDVTTSVENSEPSTRQSSPPPKSNHHTKDNDDPFIATPTPAPRHSSKQQKSSLAKSPPRQTRPSQHRTYSKPSYPSPQPKSQLPLHHSQISHTRSVIHPSPSSSLDHANSTHPTSSLTKPYYTAANTGAGRLLTFSTAQPLQTLITRIAHGVGTPKGFPVAIPQSTTVESHPPIRTVAICPGSGAGVFKDLLSSSTTTTPRRGREDDESEDEHEHDGSGGGDEAGAAPAVDLFFTGELSHHDALAATERGACVVTLFHSNSERGFLWSVLRDRLEGEVRGEWARVRDRDKGKGRVGGGGEEGEGDKDEHEQEEDDEEEISVEVSQRDRDPYGIVVLAEAVEDGIKI